MNEKHKIVHIKSRSHKHSSTANSNGTKENTHQSDAVNRNNRIFNQISNNLNQKIPNGLTKSVDHAKNKQNIEQNTIKTIDSVNGNSIHDNHTTVDKLKQNRKSFR